jgi:hypothetical protein
MKLLMPLLIGILLILNISNVQAWGVAYQDTSLVMSEGETRTIRTSLQNMVGEETIPILISIKGDREIVKNISVNDVSLPPKTKSYPVYIAIQIPEKAKDDYSFSVSYVSKEKSGIMVNIAMEKEVKFSIKVVHEKYVPPQSRSSSNSPIASNTPVTGNDGLTNSPEPQETITENQNQIPAIPTIQNESLPETVNVKEAGFPFWIPFVIIIGGIVTAWKFGYI